MLLNLPRNCEYFANSARCQAPQRKAKGTKGSNSAPSPAEAATPDAAPETCPLPLPFDTLLQSLPPMDPASAFPVFNPAALEADPAFAQFVQAMEQQQAIFNHAVMLNMQMLQDNYMLAAQLDQQLGNKA